MRRPAKAAWRPRTWGYSVICGSFIIELHRVGRQRLPHYVVHVRLQTLHSRPALIIRTFIPGTWPEAVTDAMRLITAWKRGLAC